MDKPHDDYPVKIGIQAKPIKFVLLNANIPINKVVTYRGMHRDQSETNREFDQ